MIVKCFGCMAIHNKALYKGFFHSFILTFPLVLGKNLAEVELQEVPVLMVVWWVVSMYVWSTLHASLKQ